MLQDLRAHHRRQRQGDHGRHQNRDGKGNSELAEQPADNVAHEQQRDQHRDQRYRQRNDGEPDLLGPFQRRRQRLLAFLDIARDILDHHDRVVHHEAGRNRQRHQRQIVQAVSQQIHHAERAHQRQRNRNAGNDRRGDVAQEHENDHDHQADGQHQFELHIVDRRADRIRPIRQNSDLHRRRHRRLERREQQLYAIDHGNDVRARLPLNIDDHRPRIVHPRRLAKILDVVGDVRHVAKPHRRAVSIGNDQLGVVVACESS